MISLQASQIVRSPVRAAHVAAAPALEGLSVLVVDDDRENREALAANLATEGVRVLTPAAALTALARDEDRQQALDAGFQLHLAKPIDSESLIAAVAGLAALRKTNTYGPANVGDRATLGCYG